MGFNRVKMAVVGQWPGIMDTLGIDVGRGDHRPCPVCGGKDRFRFDDRDGRGTWICSCCGAGDGIALVQKALGLNFVDTMRRLGDIVGEIPGPYPRPTRHPGQDPQKIKDALSRLWKSSVPIKDDDQVMRYLRRRGLLVADQARDLRYCQACFESETKTMLPAMLAAVRNSRGVPVSIHRTYLAGDQKAPLQSPKKLMPRTEPLQGAAVRLFDHDGVLGVAEGIETALAAFQRFEVPTWATIGAALMETFEPPAEVSDVIVFGDHDESYAGQAAAYRLAKRLKVAGMNVEVRLPAAVGDWADGL